MIQKKAKRTAAARKSTGRKAAPARNKRALPSKAGKPAKRRAAPRVSPLKGERPGQWSEAGGAAAKKTASRAAPGKVRLTIMTGNYEIVRALKDGTVQPKGIDLVV